MEISKNIFGPLTKEIQDVVGFNVIEPIKEYAYKGLEGKLRELGLNESADALIAKEVGISRHVNDETIKPLLTFQMKQGDQDTNALSDINNKVGVYGDYLRCSSTMGQINKNFSSDLSKKYTITRSLGGGKSGAYVFLVNDISQKKSYILKLYALKILDAIQDRDVREIFTTCALSGSYGFPIVHDYGTTQYNSASPFWKTFKTSYIDCVPDTLKVKDVKLYTRVYYIVTEIAGGKELSDKNLAGYKSYELISILYQLAIVFKNAKDKLPFFLHNDLHPGNIYIDDEFIDKLIYVNNETKVTGPKVSIIDFDLAITDEYPKNLAKGRQYVGKYLIQEAMMKLLNIYFGVDNTIAIINYTSRLWHPPFLHSNDDFRMWYVYKVLFELIIKVNINNEKTTDKPYVYDLDTIKGLIDGYYKESTYDFYNFDSFIDFIDMNTNLLNDGNNYFNLVRDNRANIIVELPGYDTYSGKNSSGNNLGNQHNELDLYGLKKLCDNNEECKGFNTRKQLKNKINEITEINEKGFVLYVKQPRLAKMKSKAKNILNKLQKIDSLFEIENFMNQDDDDDTKIKSFRELVTILNKKTGENVLPIEIVKFIVDSVDSLDKEIYANSNPRIHFGLHNIRYGVRINFGAIDTIEIPFYNKGNTTNIKLLPHQNKDRTVSIFGNNDFFEIILDNIIFNTNLKVDKYEGFLINVITTLLSADIKKITIHKPTGEIKIYSSSNIENTNEQLRGIISSIINWGAQESIKKALNCPGLPFDMNDFMKNVFPLIEVLLKYLYDTDSIKDTTLIISDSKGTNNKEQKINIIEIINYMRANLDKKIKENILKLPGVKDKMERVPKKDGNMVIGLKQNYNTKEIERILLYKINNATSLQGMINNLTIDRKFINKQNEKIYNETYNGQSTALIENIYKLIYKLNEDNININDLNGPMSEITGTYIKLIGIKENILNNSLTDDIVKDYYNNSVGTPIEKYIRTKQMISTSGIKNSEGFYRILDSLIIEEIKTEYTKIAYTKEKYDYLLKIYNDPSASHDTRVFIVNEFIVIIQNLKKIKLQCENDQSIHGFLSCVISNRLAENFLYLYGTYNAYDIKSYLDGYYIPDTSKFLQIFDDVKSFIQDDLVNVKKILNFTGGLTIKPKDYGTNAKITEEVIRTHILKDLKTIAAEDEIKVIIQGSGFLAGTKTISTNELKGGGSLYYKKYMKYKSKYNTLKHF